MNATLMHLAPSLLLVFMLALAVVPLLMAWQDERRRRHEGARLHGLRREARIGAELRQRAHPATTPNHAWSISPRG